MGSCGSVPVDSSVFQKHQLLFSTFHNMLIVLLGSGSQRGKDFLSVYITGGSSKCFLSASLHVNKFLNSHICVKKAKEVESEIDIIQAFKNTQNALLFFFFFCCSFQNRKRKIAWLLLGV